MEILQRNVVNVMKNNSQNGMLGNIPGQFVQCETERLTYSNFALPRMEIIYTKKIPSSSIKVVCKWSTVNLIKLFSSLLITTPLENSQLLS